MNLSNFIKSTVELHSNLILKGEQQKVVSIITKLALTNDGQTFYCTWLTDRQVIPA